MQWKLSDIKALTTEVFKSKTFSVSISYPDRNLLIEEKEPERLEVKRKFKRRNWSHIAGERVDNDDIDDLPVELMSSVGVYTTGMERVDIIDPNERYNMNLTVSQMATILFKGGQFNINKPVDILDIYDLVRRYLDMHHQRAKVEVHYQAPPAEDMSAFGVLLDKTRPIYKYLSLGRDRLNPLQSIFDLATTTIGMDLTLPITLDGAEGNVEKLDDRMETNPYAFR